MEDSKRLHTSHVHKSLIIINRVQISLHCFAVSFVAYYRATFFFQNDKTVPTLPWLVLSVSELILFSIWLLERSFRWRPVSRTVFPERLPEDSELPGVDVFIFTADPEREPTMQVMNTVISAMALDYPPEKLHVYLSDDGGSALTLNGIREARSFAVSWIPFCRRFGVQKRSPEAYFSLGDSDGDQFGSSHEFVAQREKLKKRYQEFKERVKGFRETFGDSSGYDSRDHPSVIEVIQGNSHDFTERKEEEEEEDMLPRLVYISREKRPSHPHHFKAGAINTLLRVSGVMSNSPFILALDCDMYCNDPTSARQAMCFHLDPKTSSSLAFVQFPQRFHNIQKNDIYDSQLRSTYSLMWQGLDGLDGPVLSGTGFFIKRVSLYGSFLREVSDPMELKKYFGASNEFIKSLLQNNEPTSRVTSKKLLEEANFLASCTYGGQTKWGQEVGFLHYSVAEDYLTGFVLQCKGWKSVYLSSPTPQFLGSGVTNLNDLLTQGTRWSSGLVEVGISKFCPFTYGPTKMSFFQRMCYANLSFFPLYFLPLWCFGVIPQLCLLNGIPLYPEVSSLFFFTFVFIFGSALGQHYHEVLITGGSIRSLINEQRIWMIKSVTSHMFGALDALLKRIGMREASFSLTSKVEDAELDKLHQKGTYDFRTSPLFLAPIVALFMLNLVSFFVGIARAVVVRDLDKMFLQVFMSFYVLAVNYPVFEGMVLRKDKGRVPLSITLVFILVSLQVGYRYIMY